MQYKPIVPQNIPIAMKYGYSLSSGSILKCFSEATSCSKGLNDINYTVRLTFLVHIRRAKGAGCTVSSFICVSAGAVE